MLADNPSVQEFKKLVTKKNEKLIYRKRMMTLERGAKFPKLPQKVIKSSFLIGFVFMFHYLQRGKSGSIFVKVTEHNRTVFWGDFSPKLNDIEPATIKTFRISEVKHLIVGEACPHFKDNT